MEYTIIAGKYEYTVYGKGVAIGIKCNGVEIAFLQGEEAAYLSDRLDKATTTEQTINILRDYI